MIRAIGLILVLTAYSVFMFWLCEGYGIEDCIRELRKRIPYKTRLKATQDIEIKLLMIPKMK